MIFGFYYPLFLGEVLDKQYSHITLILSNIYDSYLTFAAPVSKSEHITTIRIHITIFMYTPAPSV